MTDWIKVDYTTDEAYAATIPAHEMRIEMLRYTCDPVWHLLKGTARHLNPEGFPLPGSKPRVAVMCDIRDGVPGSAYYGMTEPPDDWQGDLTEPSDWWRPL